MAQIYSDIQSGMMDALAYVILSKADCDYSKLP